MRIRAPPVICVWSPARATRTTSSMVSGSAPMTTTFLLYREGERRLVILIADGVRDLHGDRVLAGADGFRQVDAHRRRHVPLGIERVGLLRGGLRLSPQDLAAGRDHRRHVGYVDLVLRTELVADNVEARPNAVARMVEGLLRGLRAF